MSRYLDRFEAERGNMCMLSSWREFEGEVVRKTEGWTLIKHLRIFPPSNYRRGTVHREQTCLDPLRSTIETHAKHYGCDIGAQRL